MNQSTKTACLKRLRRIEGQVRGIVQMIETDRYCIDVITQMQAARAALKRVEDEVLRDHIEHCIAGAVRSGDEQARREKIDELVEAIARSR
jgi:DNA-binding FrmR family transcriptional regulator